MGKYNFNNFQIPMTGVDGGTAGDSAHGEREFGKKMSNFGANAIGPRSSGDYTKVSKGFADFKENPTIERFIQAAEYITNPYIKGSTVKRVRNAELTIIGLGSRNAFEASFPNFDVSATKVVSNPTDDNGVALNYPTEGYKSWGGRTGGPAGV